MTTVRVLIYVVTSVYTVVTAGGVLVGVVALAGASRLGSGGLGGSGADSMLGGVLGALLGATGVFALVWAAMMALVIWFWFWAAGALGRGHRVARVLVTVFLALGVASMLWTIGVSPVDVLDTGNLAVVVLLVLGAEIGSIVALWAPASARRLFGDTAPTSATWSPPLPPAPLGWAPAAAATPLPSPRAALPTPTRHWSPEPLTAPLALPSRSSGCRGCGAATEAGWAHCSRCGARLAGDPGMSGRRM